MYILHKVFITIFFKYEYILSKIINFNEGGEDRKINGRHL